LDTAPAEDGDPVHGPARGHDLFRREAAFKQCFDDEAAQLAGGSSNDDAHD
jgi:hypothetical protein